MQLNTEDLKRRLASRTRKNGDCIEWTGCRTGGGYGQIRVDNVRWTVHRLAYTLNVAPIPDGLNVIHICDNRRCINADHLATATHNANMADMKLKGRAPHGSKHPASKLRPADIPRIKAAAFSGRRHKDIAKQFGVSRPTITKVVNGTAYRRESCG